MPSCDRLPNPLRWRAWRVVGLAVLLAAAMTFTTTDLLAQTRYVGTDEFKLPLRTGPGGDRKIIDMVSIGERMELIEDGEDWVLVRLQDGKEGWVLKRYLTSEKPSRIVLQGLQQSHASLTTRADELAQENEALKSTNAQITANLEEKTKALADLTRTHEALKISSEASNFQMRKYLIFFFSGAGILFIGVLLGLVMKRQRRKSMYMV